MFGRPSKAHQVNAVLFEPAKRDGEVLQYDIGKRDRRVILRSNIAPAHVPGSEVSRSDGKHTVQTGLSLCFFFFFSVVFFICFPSSPIASLLLQLLLFFSLSIPFPSSFFPFFSLRRSESIMGHLLEVRSCGVSVCGCVSIVIVGTHSAPRDHVLVGFARVLEGR